MNQYISTGLDYVSDRLKNFFSSAKTFFLKPNEAMKTLYALVVVGFLCFIYTWAGHGFTVPMGGDYTLQEMTFLFNGYDDWHEFFRTGRFPTWDRSVFLGVDNIGANTFYYLFDPFFLILLIFPRDWLLVLQGLSFIPKLVTGGMLFYWYLGSFEFSDKTRRLGALAYGFCGFSFAYLWFHFIDSVAFLPLIFLGVERVIKNRDPRILLIGFLLNAMTSYFFFVVFMFGGFFYAIFRFFQTIKTRSYDESMSIMGCGILTFVFGIFLGAFTLLPGMSVALSMPRMDKESYFSTIIHADSLIDAIKAIFTWEYNQSRYTPLFNFLFMPDGCYYSNLLNVYWYDNFASSLYATTPLLLLFFVALVDAIKEKKISHLIGVALTAFMILTPIGFYLFSGFTVGYARYFIIPLSWMIVFDLGAYERRRKLPARYLDISVACVLFLYIVSCILVIRAVNEQINAFTPATYWDEKMLLIILSAPWVIVCYAVMRKLFHRKAFSKAVFVMAALDVIVMGNATIIGQGTVDISSMAGGPSNIAEETKIVQAIREGEGGEDFYRIFNTTADRGNINISMREGYSGLGAFHSVYAFGAQDFLNRSRIPYTSGNWSMGVHNRRYNLETFLGTKYYIVDRINDYDAYQLPTKYNTYELSSIDNPYGYINLLDLTKEDMEKYNVEYSDSFLEFLKSDACHKSVLLNTNFVDFAFPFDTIFNEDWLMTSSYVDSKTGEVKKTYNAYEDINEYPLLRFAILEDEDYQTFAAKKKYNAGKIVMNGVETDVSSYTTANAGSIVRSAMTTNGPFVENNSAPIQFYSINNQAGKDSLRITVYAAQWPATSNNPSGEYAPCDPNDASDQSCLEGYKKEHLFEYINGIRPGDIQYDFKTKRRPDGSYYDGDGVLFNSKLVIEATDSSGKRTPIAPDADPSDPSTGVYISIFDRDNIEWRLFDENDKLISSARHSYSNYKQAHGYYADRPVYRIVGVLKEGNKTNPIRLATPYLYVQRNSDYQKAIDALRAEPIEIISRYENEILFDTKYTADKFVVLNYPNQKGWELYEITTSEESEEKVQVDVYTAQGGFIGFEAESGEHRYILEYHSPYFKEGCLLTAIGIFVTLIALIGYPMVEKSRDPYPYISSLKKKHEENIRRAKLNYDTYDE